MSAPSFKIVQMMHNIRHEFFIGRGVLVEPLDMGSGYRGRSSDRQRLPYLRRIVPAGTSITIKITPYDLPLACWELSTDFLDCEDGTKTIFRCVKIDGDYEAFKASFIIKHPMCLTDPLPPKPLHLLAMPPIRKKSPSPAKFWFFRRMKS